MGNKWYSIKANSKSLDINVHGVIGWEVNSVDILNSIVGAGGKDINMDIYSPGGDMHDGIAIYNALRQASAKGSNVTANGNTLVGSAASIMYMAADIRRIPENSYVMIHDPWAVVIGNAGEFRDAADFIDERAEKMASIYAERTGLDQGEVREWMKEEKYMDGAQAVELGFATELSEEIKLAALSKDYTEILKNVPSDLSKIKMHVDNIENERDFERFLRDAGVTKRDATALVAKAKLLYGGEPRKDEPELNELLIKMQQFGKSF